MANNLLRHIYYYLRFFFLKPHYAVLPAAIVVAIGTYIAFTMDRVYYAEALIVMESQATPSALLSPTVANERLQFIEQRVMARENLLILAKRFNLFPEVRATLSNTRLAELIRKHITFSSVMSDPSTQFVSNTSSRIGFKHTDPRTAAGVALDLVRMVIDDNRRIRVSRASDTVRFLVGEVNQLTARFRAREKVWAQYISDNGSALPNRIPALLSEIQDKEREMTAVALSFTRATEELSLLQAQLRLGMKRTDLATRRGEQLSALEADISEKMLTYAEDHPVVRGLKQRREALKMQTLQVSSTMENGLAGEGANLAPDLALIAEQIELAKPRREALQEERQHLQDRVTVLKATAARAADVETQLAANQVEREGLQRSLDEMNNKVEAARRGERLEHDDSAVNIQVIETPEVPRYPTEPRRLKVLFMVVVAAAFAGFAGLYVGDMLTPTIRGAFDLADSLEGKTLVMIPRWEASAQTRERHGSVPPSVVATG